MTPEQLAALRDYYDNTDVSDAIDRAQWETGSQPDPMVTTSLRLPKSVLDWVRAEAEAQHVKPTVLIRQWIEERRSATADLSAAGDALASTEPRVPHTDVLARYIETDEAVEGGE